MLFPNDYGLLVRITNEETIGEAFQRMIKHQMMSIPVICATTGRPLYILSMMHIVQFLLNNFKKEDFTDSLWHTITNFFNNKFDTFRHRTLKDLEKSVDYDLDPAYSVMHKTTLADALKTMVEKNCHRLLVTNSHGDLVNIVTQSRLMQFISPFVDSIPKCYTTIQELKLGFKDVVTVNESATAYDAFNKMKAYKVPGIAVVNSNGILTGSISITDLKLIGFDNSYWNLLGKTVKEYISAVRSNPEIKIRPSIFALLEDRNKPIIIKCKPSYSFGFVIRLFSYYKVHRIFIIDREDRPIGVITMSDVLDEILKL